jgi:hypothetical protein
VEWSREARANPRGEGRHVTKQDREDARIISPKNPSDG